MDRKNQNQQPHQAQGNDNGRRASSQPAQNDTVNMHSQQARISTQRLAGPIAPQSNFQNNAQELLSLSSSYNRQPRPINMIIVDVQPQTSLDSMPTPAPFNEITPVNHESAQHTITPRAPPQTIARDRVAGTKFSDNETMTIGTEQGEALTSNDRRRARSSDETGHDQHLSKKAKASTGLPRETVKESDNNLDEDMAVDGPTDLSDDVKFSDAGTSQTAPTAPTASTVVRSIVEPAFPMPCFTKQSQRNEFNQIMASGADIRTLSSESKMVVAVLLYMIPWMGVTIQCITTSGLLPEHRLHEVGHAYKVGELRLHEFLDNEIVPAFENGILEVDRLPKAGFYTSFDAAEILGDFLKYLIPHREVHNIGCVVDFSTGKESILWRPEVESCKCPLNRLGHTSTLVLSFCTSLLSRLKISGPPDGNPTETSHEEQEKIIQWIISVVSLVQSATHVVAIMDSTDLVANDLDMDGKMRFFELVASEYTLRRELLVAAAETWKEEEEWLRLFYYLLRAGIRELEGTKSNHRDVDRDLARTIADWEAYTNATENKSCKAREFFNQLRSGDAVDRVVGPSH